MFIISLEGAGTIQFPQSRGNFAADPSQYIFIFGFHSASSHRKMSVENSHYSYSTLYGMQVAKQLAKGAHFGYVGI